MGIGSLLGFDQEKMAKEAGKAAAQELISNAGALGEQMVKITTSAAIAGTKGALFEVNKYAHGLLDNVQKSVSFPLVQVVQSTSEVVTNHTMVGLLYKAASASMEYLNEMQSAASGLTKNYVKGGADVSRAATVAAQGSPVSMDVLASRNTLSGSSKA